MAWKISLTWWVTHLKRSCACSSPAPPGPAPRLEGGCSRSTSSSSGAARSPGGPAPRPAGPPDPRTWPPRTSPSLRRRSAPAGGVQAQEAAPAGLAEEGDEVREREAAGIADEDHRGGAGAAALAGVREKQRGGPARWAAGRSAPAGSQRRREASSLRGATALRPRPEAGGHGRVALSRPPRRCLSAATPARRRAVWRAARAPGRGPACRPLTKTVGVALTLAGAPAESLRPRASSWYVLSAWALLASRPRRCPALARSPG